MKKIDSKPNISWVRLKKNKLTLFGIFLILLLIMVAVFSGIMLDFRNDIIKQNITNRLQLPGNGHIFGTDAYGRDIFLRLIYGTRYSLSIGTISILLSMLVGGTIGSIAGYSGGIFDDILMRFVDVFLAIPSIVMTIAIVSVLGSGYKNLIIIMAISNTPYMSRLTRSLVISFKELDFVESARAIGASDTRIILKHIIPNCLGPLLVQFTFSVASVILSVAGIGFLGIGIQPPLPEWGTMLAEGRQYMRYYPHLVIFPGIAIALLVLLFNLTGDGLRDILDPRLK